MNDTIALLLAEIQTVADLRDAAKQQVAGTTAQLATLRSALRAERRLQRQKQEELRMANKLDRLVKREQRALERSVAETRKKLRADRKHGEVKVYTKEEIAAMNA